MYGNKNNPLQNISSYCETCKRKAKCITWDFYGRASLDSKVCSRRPVELTDQTYPSCFYSLMRKKPDSTVSKNLLEN